MVLVNFHVELEERSLQLREVVVDRGLDRAVRDRCHAFVDEHVPERDPRPLLGGHIVRQVERQLNTSAFPVGVERFQLTDLPQKVQIVLEVCFIRLTVAILVPQILPQDFEYEWVGGVLDHANQDIRKRLALSASTEEPA